MVSSSTNDEVEEERPTPPKKLVSTLGKEEQSKQSDDEEEESESIAADYGPQNKDSDGRNKSVSAPLSPVEEYVQSTQKNPSSRSISEQDEIILLKGFKEFRRKHGVNVNWFEFHQVIESQLSTDCSKTQIYEKIRRLKQKFEGKTKRQNSKKPPPPLDGHEARLFKLSKSIWGNDVDSTRSISMRKGKRVKKGKGGLNDDDDLQDVSNKKSKKSTEEEHVNPEGEEEDDDDDDDADPADYPLLGSFLDDISLPAMLKKYWTLIEKKTAKKLQKQWENLYQKELTLTIEKLNFKHEVHRLMLDQAKGNY